LAMTEARAVSMETRAASALAVPDGDFVPGDEWFAAPRQSFGAAFLDLDVGPLRFRLDGLSGTQAEQLRARFSPFVADRSAAGAPDLALHLRRADRTHFLRLPAGRHEIYRMDRRFMADVRDVWSYEFAGRLSLSGREADLTLVEESGALFDRGLENYLRTLTASLILDRGGLLVHSAAVVRGGRGYLFFGPSGSGKTTVTRLSPHDTVLSDDLALVLPDGQGYSIAGIPFGMAHHHVPDTNQSFPLGGLLRLVQSTEVVRRRLEGAVALADLASCLPFVMQERTEAARALENAGRLLGAVPAWRLHFREDDAFWKVIEEA
jgi:hypothetical protein